MTSGEFARHLNTTRRVVDHAEEMGLLQPAARTPEGHRLYGPAQARRLTLVMRLYDFGVSAARIKEWLASPSEQLPQRLAAHRAWLREQAERALVQARE